MTSTSIEWTEVTWNPVTGCDRISAGCDNCYALKMARRLKAMGAAKYQKDGDPRTSGPGFGIAVHEDAMTEPLRWRSARLVFVNSMSDIAHARVPRWAQALIWAVMALTPRHQYQILTKRSKRLATLLTDPAFYAEITDAIHKVLDQFDGRLPVEDVDAAMRWADPRQRLRGEIPAPLPNVWIGTSIESDDYCWRADELRRTPAAIRFLSCEPLLGPLPSLDLADIDWVIVGGESGHRFRPLDLDGCVTCGTAVCSVASACSSSRSGHPPEGRRPVAGRADLGRDAQSLTGSQGPQRREPAADPASPKNTHPISRLITV